MGTAMTTCLRCQGCLVTERWPSLLVTFTRCLNCGDVTDETIMVNRLQSKPPAWMVAEVLLAELRGSPA